MLFAAAHPHLHRNVYASAGRTLERFLDDARMGARAAQTHYTQDETSFTLSLDLPGIAKEQLGIKEGAPRHYRAAYEMPQEIDAATSQARLENGVLTLKLAKVVPVSKATEIDVL
jgi:HSP20 family molecular chaperone IbpA